MVLQDAGVDVRGQAGPEKVRILGLRQAIDGVAGSAEERGAGVARHGVGRAGQRGKDHVGRLVLDAVHLIRDVHVEDTVLQLHADDIDMIGEVVMGAAAAAREGQGSAAAMPPVTVRLLWRAGAVDLTRWGEHRGRHYPGQEH